MLDNKNHHNERLPNYKVPKECKGIAVDLGVAIGEFSKNYSEQFDFIYGFEPVYTNMVRAIYNTRKCDNVMILPLALSHTPLDIITMKSTGQNLYSYTSDVTPEIRDFKYNHTSPASNETQTIFGINLENILKLTGGKINYLKSDCEGAELCLLDDELVQHIDYIGMEVHPFIYGHDNLKKLSNFFSKYFDGNLDDKRMWYLKNKKLNK